MRRRRNSFRGAEVLRSANELKYSSLFPVIILKSFLFILLFTYLSMIFNWIWKQWEKYANYTLIFRTKNERGIVQSRIIYIHTYIGKWKNKKFGNSFSFGIFFLAILEMWNNFFIFILGWEYGWECGLGLNL